MTAIELLSEFRQAGGRLIPDGDVLRWQSPVEPPPRLLEALRERKQDLLTLLRPLELPCLACGGMYRWADSAGAWHCGGCEPDPRAHRLRGVTLAVIGDHRAISLTAPTSDLPAPGSWARTAAGTVCELVLYRADGGEVLMRNLRQPEHLAWFDPAAVTWESDWGRA